MCELTGEKMNAATSEPREWWMVLGVRDKDKEIFPTRALADALALVNNFRYEGLGPYRVLHVMEDDADAPDPGVAIDGAEYAMADR